jgi:hypothetical protein
MSLDRRKNKIVPVAFTNATWVKKITRWYMRILLTALEQLVDLNQTAFASPVTNK